VRSDQRLDFAARNLALLREEIERAYRTLRLTPDLVELRNLALVGNLIVVCAQRRRESRGSTTRSTIRPGGAAVPPTVVRRGALERRDRRAL
jgi:aspartate oxidase